MEIYQKASCKKDTMTTKEKSCRVIWIELSALLTLVALALLSVPGPSSSAQTQTQSRQLNRQTDSVKSWPIKAKRWALVIGVDQYRDGQINALKGSVNDAHNLASALVSYAGFAQDQVIVLTTDQPEERQPTRINILTYLSNLASLVPKDGLLLVSFAGHGIERGGQAYLIPSDARLSHDVSLLEESAVSVTRMHDRIKAIGVGQVIVLLDACRNDPGGRADAPNNMSAAYAKFNFDVRNREVQAFATFYATAIGQRAYEYTEKRQGYFTWAIVEGLRGGAANEKGEVTLAALVKYVQDNVPKRIAIDLGAGQQQKPFATIEGYRADELVIAISGPNVAGTNTSTANSPDPAAFELSYWETIKTSTDAEDFKLYLQKYPNGPFADLAKNKIKSLEASANSVPPKSASSDSSATELAFWDSIKNSTDAEDFKSYLDKYPNGQMVPLARNRLTMLGRTNSPSNLPLPKPAEPGDSDTAGEKAALAHLKRAYRDWLTKDVAYIVTAEERRVFLRLASDEQLEGFIEQFWRRRDPTPGTELNEFKEEYYNRIAQANEKFSGDLPGWKTARGRIYITLGPPDEIRKGPPGEMWFYRHTSAYGNNVEVEFTEGSGSGSDAFQMRRVP